MTEPRRCWPTGDDALMSAYHDDEWGVPAHDDRRHFEYLILDGFQAGLSWRTILHKRVNFQRAFANFDPARVAKFSTRDLKRLLADPGIVRNRLKVAGAVRNAQAFRRAQDEVGACDRFTARLTGRETRRSAC